jgi:hypothetical protein
MPKRKTGQWPSILVIVLLVFTASDYIIGILAIVFFGI